MKCNWTIFSWWCCWCEMHMRKLQVCHTTRPAPNQHNPHRLNLFVHCRTITMELIVLRWVSKWSDPSPHTDKEVELVLGMSKNTSNSIVMMQAQNGSTKFEMDQMVHVILTDLDSVAVFHMMQALQCCCWCARECWQWPLWTCHNVHCWIDCSTRTSIEF